MSKVQFIPNLSKEILLFPSRIDEDIADDAPVRIIDYVLDKIDISNILKLYHVKGRNAFYPRMMLKVIIYAYMNNIYSCRRIEELLKRDIQAHPTNPVECCADANPKTMLPNDT
ncbi:MAG: transposase [Hallella sp.]|uniref:transposase n=1 Tax=Hallella sp. TaxID=2980186 RepID=UPI002E75EF7C|nr:transposase [Hallella sp.]MED9946521.1 transposase [Hallella sp.]